MKHFEPAAAAAAAGAAAGAGAADAATGISAEGASPTEETVAGGNEFSGAAAAGGKAAPAADADAGEPAAAEAAAVGRGGLKRCRDESKAADDGANEGKKAAVIEID